MRRRPQEPDQPAISFRDPAPQTSGDTGLILSGGGSRAAYQVGALKALAPFLKDRNQGISVIVGSSIGAINGLITAACLKHGLDHAVEELESVWRERNFRNTFTGTPSQAFFRAIKIAVLQYLAPGPNPTSNAIFNPAPLMERVDSVIQKNGGLNPASRASQLHAVAVMTTMEGAQRKPLLFLSSQEKLDASSMEGSSFEVCQVAELSAKHGFASAALPSVLPPVELDVDFGKVRLVDGGISQNIPVDPAVRLGAQRVIVVDVSGRNWWLDHYGESHDTRPAWEIPAGFKTFCLRPPGTFVSRCRTALGPLLRQAVGRSRGKFMSAVGPTWPVFTLLKNKFGEEVAFEAMSYVALDPDYLQALIEQGFNETTHILRAKTGLEFERTENYENWAKSL